MLMLYLTISEMFKPKRSSQFHASSFYHEKSLKELLRQNAVL